MNEKSNIIQDDREKIIVKTSIIGILANVILAAFKAFVGVITNSIAVTLDAVNNLSDAVSSIITILGAKLSGKAPDKKHPYGYGRIEYLSELVIAAIVLYAGITSLKESIKKIIHPEDSNYTTVFFVILISAIIVKLLLGQYVKKKGEQANSGSLIASGKDAMFDSILSISVLVSAIIYVMSGISLEAYVGAIISIVIIKSGLEMIGGAIDEMIGVRAEGDFSKSIKETIAKEPEVKGVYDLIINNYGPDRYMASAHIEIPDTMTAGEIDELTRKIQENVYRKHAVIMAAIGIYSVNTNNDVITKIHERIRQLSMSEDGVLQMHGFFVDTEDKRINFDLVIDFDVENRSGLIEVIKKKVEKEFPDYKIHITLDNDFSD
ncbi:MAG: cation diffusion facilitator family transporter [Clostridium sp.]|uniref:cation diffusion facilitator family transporter n=1 Tax=Clostridium sp. DSM 8431 TaxID=1761781 RepID=UPI0008E0568A|nr:cation diffusion facilitator family transporter [Clostridium sp. DSM 8431]MCR4943594.1 cation diffusion facilitator family transporter [Clostridium sp.]SFU35979.1 cation diffusion facilitator family transporter [Clostridium sp. DSM 8431]